MNFNADDQSVVTSENSTDVSIDSMVEKANMGANLHGVSFDGMSTGTDEAVSAELAQLQDEFTEDEIDESVDAVGDGQDQQQADSQEDEPFKVFASQNDYQAEIDGIIGRRLKDHREVAQMTDGMKVMLGQMYGVDPEKAYETLYNDYITRQAEANSVPPEVMREQINTQRELEQTRGELEQLRAVEQRGKFLDKVEQQVTEFKKKNPDFDMGSEVANPAFIQHIQKGLSVEDAYYLVHKDDIAKAISEQAEKATLQNLQAKGQRISENAVSGGNGANAVPSIKGLSDSEILDIAARAARGERIVL